MIKKTLIRLGKTEFPFRETFMSLGFIGLIFILDNNLNIASALADKMNVTLGFPYGLIPVIVISAIFSPLWVIFIIDKIFGFFTKA